MNLLRKQLDKNEEVSVLLDYGADPTAIKHFW
jgi:hypothetical protein